MWLCRAGAAPGAPPAYIQKISLLTQLQPQATQQNNGLRDFGLNYSYCGQNQNCQNFFAYPTSVETSALGSLVRFEPNWPVPPDPSRGTGKLFFYGEIAKTGAATSSISNRIQAVIQGAAIGYTAYTLTRPAPANWMTILPGYGYPLRRK